MQKNYKDFTVGELLDLGLTVELLSHDFKGKEAKKIVNLLEGTKQSTHKLSNDTNVVKAWKGKFITTLFVKESQ